MQNIASLIDNKGQTNEMKVYNKVGQFDYQRTYPYDKTCFLGNAPEIKTYIDPPSHRMTTEKYLHNRQVHSIQAILFDKEGTPAFCKTFKKITQ